MGTSNCCEGEVVHLPYVQCFLLFHWSGGEFLWFAGSFHQPPHNPRLTDWPGQGEGVDPLGNL